MPCTPALETDTSICQEARDKFRRAGHRVETREDLKRVRAEGVELISGTEGENIQRRARSRTEQQWQDTIRD